MFDAAFAGLVLAAVCPELPRTLDPERPDDWRPAARIDGRAVSLAEVDETISEALCQARRTYADTVYTLRDEALRRLIDERLLAAEARRRKLPDTAALDAALASETARPDEAAARAWYTEHAERLGGQSFEALHDRLLDTLARQAVWEARHRLLNSLRGAHRVHTALDPPRTPVEATGPARGPADARITVVMFADFECPYCAAGAETVEALRSNHRDALRVVYRDFPLELHERAIGAATAARCAGQQGAFWPMHDALYAQQEKLGPALYAEQARGLGLDGVRFETCLADAEVAEAIERDAEAGRAAGVEATPAFFINGIRVSGAQPLSAFESIVSRELARPPRTP